MVALFFGAMEIRQTVLSTNGDFNRWSRWPNVSATRTRLVPGFHRFASAPKLGSVTAKVDQLVGLLAVQALDGVCQPPFPCSSCGRRGSSIRSGQPSSSNALSTALIQGGQFYESAGHLQASHAGIPAGAAASAPNAMLVLSYFLDACRARFLEFARKIEYRSRHVKWRQDETALLHKVQISCGREFAFVLTRNRDFASMFDQSIGIRSSYNPFPGADEWKRQNPKQVSRSKASNSMPQIAQR